MKRCRYYWDSCLFIAWLQNEVRSDPRDMPGLEEVLKQNEEGKVIIVTSLLTALEVLGKPPSLESAGKFLDACRKPELQVIQPNRKIIETALKLRLTAKPNPNSPKLLGLLDAVHLATAMVTEVDELQTFDSKHLLPLSLQPEIKIKITKPRMGQMTVESFLSEGENDEEQE